MRNRQLGSGLKISVAGFDAMSKRYLGLDTYPHAQPGEVFTVAVVTPTKVIHMP
jgi:hypothetical protein